MICGISVTCNLPEALEGNVVGWKVRRVTRERERKTLQLFGGSVGERSDRGKGRVREWKNEARR